MEKEIRRPAIKISQDEEKELLRLVRGFKTPREMALRANIILAAAGGQPNRAIARE